MPTVNLPKPTHMTFAQQMKRGLALASVLGLLLLSTAIIPELKRLPAIRREEVRAVHPRSAIQVAPRIVSGDLAIVNFVHKPVSVHGLLADQLDRLFVAAVFLGLYSLRILSSSRAVRTGMGAFSLLGAAGCLSDAVSFWMLGGVVDWIGVNGHSAFSPSDLCWGVAPAGILLIVTLGLLTFNDSAGGLSRAAKQLAPGAPVSTPLRLSWSWPVT